jgi:uncharacterized protein (TIGR03437 family)
MGRLVYSKATLRVVIATVLWFGGISVGWSQPTVPASVPDWRRVGNTAIDWSLAALATGPVNRVWYSTSGSLLIETAARRVLETKDFETWRPAATPVPAEAQNAPVVRLPESNAQVRTPVAAPATAYAFGKFVYRSDDGGANWDNLTGFRNTSILGDDVRDLAVAPSNPDEIVVASGAGVFRSLDAGKTWSGLNQALPNLPAAHLLSLPGGEQGVRLALAQATGAVEWKPGEKIAWRPSDNADQAAENLLRETYSSRLGAGITAITSSGESIYAGFVDGRVVASHDHGVSWERWALGAEAGAVERFWIDPTDPRTALAIVGFRPRDAASPIPAVHVVHTTNGGGYWAQLTGDLPDTGAHGVAADRTTGAVYVATDRGVFMTYIDLGVMGSPAHWTQVAGLPADTAADVKLDPQGNQLYAAMQSYGVYATLAPHRMRDPKVVSTADLVARATSPGSLISILGAKVQTARAGDLAVPVLTATENESQLQIPFEARGDSLSLAVEGANGRMTMPVQLESVSPGIFVDREDGSPILLDGETGVMLDAMNTAHSHGRIQILATGLGRVTPDWPTGLAGPAENPPQVAATVTAYLDRQPVEVSRAVLAPYIGFYMVEIEVPKIVNYGPAELYIEVGGKASNRVRVYIEP